MTERQHLLKKLMAERFAAIETSIFLDTHPNDKKALEAMRKYVACYKELRDEYEKKFGPLTAFSDVGNENTWTWINDPWPWD